jgi:hypothetical protein
VGDVSVSLVSVPKGADPNKQYYFGEATYKPKFTKGGGITNAEAKRAIDSVVRGDKSVSLGGVARSQPESPSSQPSSSLGEGLNNYFQQKFNNEEIEASRSQGQENLAQQGELYQQENQAGQNLNTQKQSSTNANGFSGATLSIASCQHSIASPRLLLVRYKLR